MNEWASGYSGTFVTLDEDLEREFEHRLRESSTLAFRVAYGVLRNRQDAEDVAQEAFAKAYRSFTQLRDRDRFKAWLVRMTWRLAIDRWRSDRRRTAREQTRRDGRGPDDRGRGAVARAIGPALARDRCAAGEAADRHHLGAIEGHDIRAMAQAAGIAGRHGEVQVVSGPTRAGGESAMSRTEQMTEFDERTVSEAEADLERLLSIEPSTEFAAKVRERIAAEPPVRRWNWGRLALRIGRSGRAGHRGDAVEHLG